jgi:hypothetical protein
LIETILQEPQSGRLQNQPPVLHPVDIDNLNADFWELTETKTIGLIYVVDYKKEGINPI